MASSFPVAKVYRKSIIVRTSFGGGPAAKIASVIAQLSADRNNQSISFVFDGAEQSNESASAHYEHINHANALNAEHDNGGMGILLLALRRAMLGEPDPSVALSPNYRRVDLWPSSVSMLHVPLMLHNEMHGRIQRLKSWLGVMNDHDKSRIASKLSTRILSYLLFTELWGITMVRTNVRLNNSRQKAESELWQATLAVIR